ETAEVRLDQGGKAGSSASARLTARFGPHTAHAARDCPCRGSSRARTWPQHPRESGECRIKANAVNALIMPTSTTSSSGDIFFLPLQGDRNRRKMVPCRVEGIDLGQ